jgi:arylsulfatase A-like enzyme
MLQTVFSTPQVETQGHALAAWLCWIVATLVVGCEPTPDPRMNLLLVSVDTLSCSALEMSGPQAADLPYLQRFSTRALRFTRAHSSASWTLPAQASLLTGLYPDRHGANSEFVRIGTHVPTLAGMLRQAGYRTVGFTDGVNLDRLYGFSAGFDRYDEWTDAETQLRELELPREGRMNPLNGSMLFDRAIAFLSQRIRDDPPFFLFVQTYAVHDYFMVHPWAMDQLSDRELRATSDYLDILLGLRTGSEEDWKQLRDLYRAELPNLDAGFGRLLGELGRQGLNDSTYVVVTSDHGEGFDAARGRIHHGGRLHADQLCVPLLVSGPGVIPGRTDESVSLVDVVPTVLEILGVPAVEGLDGVPLGTVLRGESLSGSRALYAMEHYHLWEGGQRRNLLAVGMKPSLLAVIAGDSWYIQGQSREVLYDMAEDPEQTQSQISNGALLREMRRWASARRRYSPPVERIELHPELREKLRALGYLER